MSQTKAIRGRVILFFVLGMIAGLSISLTIFMSRRSLGEKEFSPNPTENIQQIYLPKDGLAQSQSIAIIDSQNWLVGFTAAQNESAGDQSVYITSTSNAGRTFSEPIAIEANFDNRHPAGWLELAFVPNIRRVYAFYFWNESGSPLRDGTGIYVRHSDDLGKSWSERERVAIPRLDIAEGKEDIHGWFMDRPVIGKSGSLLVGVTLIKPSTIKDGADNWHTEIFFLRIPNIAKIKQPKSSDIQFIEPGDGSGLKVPHPANERSFAQEPSIVASDERFVAIFRTRLGSIYYSESKDDGVSWRSSEPLLYYPGGPPLLNPAGPAVIRNLGDGRYIILFYNNPGGAWYRAGKWSEFWEPRTPTYMTVGTLSGSPKNAGLRFNIPGQLLSHAGALESAQSQLPSYPDFEVVGNRFYLFYSLSKKGIVFKRVPRVFVDHLSPLPYYRSANDAERRSND